MNTKNDKITITERAILELVRYKTRNNYIFFGGNDYIAKAMDITKNSAKTLVNHLIRMGYLNKTYDKYKRRVLSLSDKPYLRLFEDFTGVNKKIVTLERDDALRDSAYYQNELNGANLTIERLNQEKMKIQIELIDQKTENMRLQDRVTRLENIFLSKGMTREQLESVISQ